MRLFIAIPLIDVIRGAIGVEQERLRRALGERAHSLRWVSVSQIHLTLAFIGEVDEPQAAEVQEALTADLPHRPFDLTVGGCGVFPARGAPRILWMGVVEGNEEAMDLQAAVAARLDAAGVPFDHKPFHPHLTMARWRDSRPSDRRAVLNSCGGAMSRRDGAARATMRVESVYLYRSQLPGGRSAAGTGPTYTELARAALVC